VAHRKQPATNRHVAGILSVMAQLLEIAGRDAFKVRAYYRAAQQLERMGPPVTGMTEDELVGVQGIGKTIARNIIEIITTGSFAELEEIRAGIPPTLIQLLDIDGVGPKTINTLWKRLNIESIEDLESAAKSRRIRALRGFGEKKEANILRALDQFKRKSGRMTRVEADDVVQRITAGFIPDTFAVAGSYRRGKSTIGDIDIVTTENRSSVSTRLATVADEVIDEGERKTSVRTGERRVDIRFTDTDHYGSMLLYLTGSKDFNIKLREVARIQGYKLNEYGLEERKSGMLHTFASEEELFAFLGMAWIPPELREDQGEVELALQGTLPALVDLPDIRGDLHAHSRWSDGRLTLEEVAQAGDDRGYEYILITDHSSSLGVTHGLDTGRIREQQQEIEQVNRHHACRLLCGTEVDIKSDGTLGLANSALADLDLVIASVHSGFKQEKDVITRRILSASENEHVDIIGHPTGRLLGRRPPYDLDMARVIDHAAETGTALEINASPLRFDLDDIYIRQAKEQGVKLAAGTDSHRIHEFSNMRYGVILARRGWCAAADLLNTRTLSDLLEWTR